MAKRDILPPEENEEVENDKDLLQFVAQVQLVQKYTNEIQEFLSRLKNIKEEIVIVVGEREKSIYNFTFQQSERKLRK
jgi:hypothetical protein